jgi:RNA 2',3'-cyclic 3'-phosphodiesterase
MDDIRQLRSPLMSETVSPEKFRLFIAIPLPEPVRDELEKAQTELRGVLPGNTVRWTRRGQFHLTLRFLGDVEARHVDALAEILRGVGQSFPALELEVKGIGCFPDWRHPRVIWAGIEDRSGALPQLHSAIEMVVKEFTREKAEAKFTGHVTLGRVQGLNRPETEALAKVAESMAGRRCGVWTADKMELIRSELLSGGPRYTVMIESPLKSAGKE